MRSYLFWALILFASVLSGCFYSSEDLAPHNVVSFDEMDTNNDTVLTYSEFTADHAFTQATPLDFSEIDLDASQTIDRNEWLEFTRSHPPKDMERRSEPGFDAAPSFIENR